MMADAFTLYGPQYPLDIHGVRCAPIGCCVRCGRVGTREVLNVHDCSGPFVVETAERPEPYVPRPPKPSDGAQLRPLSPKLESLWGSRKPRSLIEEIWHARKPTQPNQPRPPSSEYANPTPTSARLTGILRTVADTPKGNRQAIGYWAAGKLLEAGYGTAAWDALEHAMRATGASEHDIRTALRERPGHGRVPS